MKNSILTSILVFISAHMTYSMGAPDCETMVQNARELSWQKEYKQAIDLYHQCLDVYPADLDIQFGLAQSYFWDGQNQIAMQYIESIEKSNPQFEGLEQLKSQVQQASQAPAPTPSVTQWKLGYQFGIAQEDEVNFETHDPLVQIQSLNNIAYLQWDHQQHTIKIQPELNRHQEDLQTIQRNNNSIWDKTLGLSYYQQVYPQLQTQFQYQFKQFENAWATHFLIQEPSQIHLYQLNLIYRQDAHQLRWYNAKDVYLSKDFANTTTEILNRFQHSLYYQWDSQSQGPLQDIYLLSHWTRYLKSHHVSQTNQQIRMRLGSHYHWLLDMHTHLQYSRFQKDLSYYNSHDHQILINQDISHTLSLAQHQFTPSLELETQYVDEGIYNIEGSLTGLPSPSEFRWIYSVKPKLQYITPYGHQWELFYFINSDQYQAFGLQISQELQL